MLGFRMPTRVEIRPGCLADLPQVARELNASSSLLVMDPGLAATPWPERVRRALGDASIRVEVFDQVEANPRTTTAEKIAGQITDAGLDLVIGLGGGSSLDAAKAGAMLATNPGRPVGELAGKELYEHAPKPLIAVPTTCGTGSEVTWVSVLSDTENRTKISVKGDSMFPNQALVDADLIRTLPANLVTWTGLDAMTHAIEATTCSVGNPVSDALAESAIALLFEYLPRAAQDVENDHEARAEVMRAATIAGLAFGNADVAGVHCLSESLGGMFDVPHGLANAILLTPVLRHHGTHVESRLAALASRVHGDAREVPENERAEAFLTRLQGLVTTLEVPSFHSFDIGPEHYDAIAAAAVANGSNDSNPQPMAETNYLEILRGL